MEKCHPYYKLSIKFAIGWSLLLLRSIIFTDSRAFTSWIFLNKFYSIFGKVLVINGLNSYRKIHFLSLNASECDNMHVTMAQMSKVGKTRNRDPPINPFWSSVTYILHLYHVPFVTS